MTLPLAGPGEAAWTALAAGSAPAVRATVSPTTSASVRAGRRGWAVRWRSGVRCSGGSDMSQSLCKVCGQVVEGRGAGLERGQHRLLRLRRGANRCRVVRADIEQHRTHLVRAAGRRIALVELENDRPGARRKDRRRQLGAQQSGRRQLAKSTCCNTNDAICFSTLAGSLRNRPRRSPCRSDL